MQESSETTPRVVESAAPAPTTRDLAPLVVLCFVTIIWAANFIFSKRAVAAVPPIPLTALRVVPGCLVFLLACGAEGRKRVFRLDTLRATLPLAVLGIVLNQVLFIAGLDRTTPTRSAIVVALIPVCVALLAHRFLRERMGLLRAAGILAAFAGVAVVELRGGGEAFQARHFLGDGITLLAVFAFSSYTVIAKSLMPRLGPLVAMAACYLVAAVILVPAALPQALSFDWSGVPVARWLDVGYIVFFATIVAYLGHSWALSKIDSSRVAVFTCAQPVLAGLCSWMWLNEVVTPSLAAGGALALLGVALVQIG